MYTNYEAANVALLQATVGAEPPRPGGGRPAGRRAAGAATPSPSGTSAAAGSPTPPCRTAGTSTRGWTGTTALAAMAASPRCRAARVGAARRAAGGRPADRARRGQLAVPDGIAELVLVQVAPGRGAAPPAQAYAAGGAVDRPGSTGARPPATPTPC